jgi:hypothetical protein
MEVVEKKYKPRYRLVRDILLVILGFFLIFIGFLLLTTHVEQGMEYVNIRYGLGALALIPTGAYFIGLIYRRSKKYR